MSTVDEHSSSPSPPSTSADSSSSNANEASETLVYASWAKEYPEAQKYIDRAVNDKWTWGNQKALQVFDTALKKGHNRVAVGLALRSFPTAPLDMCLRCEEHDPTPVFALPGHLYRVSLALHQQDVVSLLSLFFHSNVAHHAMNPTLLYRLLHQAVNKQHALYACVPNLLRAIVKTTHRDRLMSPADQHPTVLDYVFWLCKEHDLQSDNVSTATLDKVSCCLDAWLASL